MNIKMYCWIEKVKDTHWMEFKVKTIEWEYIRLTKFHCLVLMAKYIFKTMDVTD